ncbi:hypothetical protein ACLOJK_026272 [Asimina triloba]
MQGLGLGLPQAKEEEGERSRRRQCRRRREQRVCENFNISFSKSANTTQGTLGGLRANVLCATSGEDRRKHIHPASSDDGEKRAHYFKYGTKRPRSRSMIAFPTLASVSVITDSHVKESKRRRTAKRSMRLGSWISAAHLVGHRRNLVAAAYV